MKYQNTIDVWMMRYDDSSVPNIELEVEQGAEMRYEISFPKYDGEEWALWPDDDANQLKSYAALYNADGHCEWVDSYYTDSFTIKFRPEECPQSFREGMFLYLDGDASGYVLCLIHFYNTDI